MDKNRLFECDYGFREVEKFDTSNPLMEPGEKFLAEKLNELKNLGLYIFREYNVVGLRRADFIIYYPGEFLTVLEVKDWGVNFIKDIIGTRKGGMKFLTPFGNKNPYKSQAYSYAKSLSDQFKKNLPNNKKIKNNEIQIFSFVVFTRLTFEELKQQGYENVIEPNYISNFENYSIFSNELVDFWNFFDKKRSLQDTENKKNEIGLLNLKFRYNNDNKEMLDFFMKHNSLSIEKPLDKKQIELAQTIEVSDRNFLFIYGTVGSGKTLILKKRIEIFKSKKQFEEIEPSKKLIVIMKDEHSLLFKEYSTKQNSDVLVIPLIQSTYETKIEEDGISSTPYGTIKWEEIHEILIEEGHSIISNSKKSLDKLKVLYESSYVKKLGNTKIVMTLDSNQIQYKSYYRNNFKKVRLDLPIYFGLEISDFYNCELNISYRLSSTSNDFSFKYLIKNMEENNLLNNVTQTNSPEGFTRLLKRNEYYYINFCDEGYETALKNHIEEVIKKFPTHNNLILFLDNVSHLKFDNISNVQTLKSLQDIDDFNPDAKVTICYRPEFLGGFEFNNVIIITTPEKFFLDNYSGDDLYEQLHKNYISLTRSTGEFKIYFFNKYSSPDNISGKIVYERMEHIKSKEIDLLEYYRNHLTL